MTLFYGFFFWQKGRRCREVDPTLVLKFDFAPSKVLPYQKWNNFVGSPDFSSISYLLFPGCFPSFTSNLMYVLFWWVTYVMLGSFFVFFFLAELYKIHWCNVLIFLIYFKVLKLVFTSFFFLRYNRRTGWK